MEVVDHVEQAATLDVMEGEEARKPRRHLSWRVSLSVRERSYDSIGCQGVINQLKDSKSLKGLPGSRQLAVSNPETQKATRGQIQCPLCGSMNAGISKAIEVERVITLWREIYR